MKKILSLILAFIICIPVCVFSASAVDPAVYTLDGKRTVFMSQDGADVTYGGETYGAYATLKNAFTALGTQGGVIIVCGNVTDPTTNGDSTFSDLSERQHILIKGDTTSAVLGFNHTLSFRGGPITLEGFTLKCLSTKYVEGGGNFVFGNGMKTEGGIFFRNGANKVLSLVRAEFNSNAIIKQLNMGDGADIGTADSATPALAEMILNDISYQNGGAINLGMSNTNRKIYGNVNLYINGGTYSTKSISVSKVDASSKVLYTVIFNNGLATGFTVADNINYVVKSATGGTVSIKTQATYENKTPTFILTPNEGLSPKVNGLFISKTGSEYLYTPTASTEQQVINIEWAVKPAVVAQVNDIDGKRTVFMSQDGANVTYGGETYGAYATLKNAFTALGTQGGVIIVCGNVTDPTTNGDSTFSDVNGRQHVLIKGDTTSAVLGFNHTLSFRGGPITLEGFTLKCLSIKYVEGGGNFVFGNGMRTEGGIYFRNGANKILPLVRAEFNSNAIIKQLNMGEGADIGTADSATPALAEMILNDISYQNGGAINLGMSNTKRKIYGNVNLYINGGTYSTKSISVSNVDASSKALYTVIFNNGMATGFTVANNINYVVKSAEGGTVSIKTQATYENKTPTFLFTPDAGKKPLIDGVALTLTSDNEYVYTPIATEQQQIINVTWIEDTGTTADPVFYFVEGAKTAFVKNGGGEYNYNGMDVVAFDTFLNACNANATAGKPAITLIIIGEITDNLSMPNQYPAHLTIIGADENALWNFTGGSIHPWGKTTIDNITIGGTQNTINADGKQLTIGNGVTGTFKQVFGGGAGSPHGGNLTLNAGTYTGNIYAGSNVATTTANAGHYLTINGGTYSSATIDGGSEASTTVPKDVVVTINGGTFANGQQIKLSNVTSAGGIKAAIINNGIAKTANLSIAEGYDYIIKSEAGGMVVFDGEAFILNGEEGRAPVVNNALNPYGRIEVGTPGTYEIKWVEANGSPTTYTIDGVKTAFVKTGGGIVELNADGTGKYAYDNILTATKAALGGKVVIVGKYTGNLRDYWQGGNAETIVTGYDSSAEWTFDAFYNWTPIVFENITLKKGADKVNIVADARKFKIGDNVTMLGDGFDITGGAGSPDRNIDLTINSGKYATVNAGNSAQIGSTGTNYSIKVIINGGDFTTATVNIGNPGSAVRKLYGNYYAEINGGTFANGQQIKFDKIDVVGKSTLVLKNGIETTYNLGIPTDIDYLVKLSNGGTIIPVNYGGETSAPTYEFRPDSVSMAPVVNGTMLTSNNAGKYIYIPEVSDSQTVINVTWEEDTRPKAYVIDDVLTAFVSANSDVVIDGVTYRAFGKLTDAIASLAKSEGVVIIASDVTNDGGDANAFRDTENRQGVTIKGLTGTEVFTIDGTLGFKGATVLDNFTLKIPQSVYAKYLHGSGEITFGANFKVAQNEGHVYFASVNASNAEVNKDINVTVNGGSFNIFNVSGVYAKLMPGNTVYAVINGGTITNFNLGMPETGTVGANVTVEINADAIPSKQIGFNKTKTTISGNPTFIVILNNGITGYTLTTEANEVVDYIVKSSAGGCVSVYEDATETTAPTFILKPNGNNIPKIDGMFIEKVDNVYLYTPALATAQTTINVEWIDEATVVPTVYTIDGKQHAFVKNGGGVVYFADSARFAYNDLGSAIQALGTQSGYVYISGTCVYKEDTPQSTFSDVTGRQKLYIRGIEGTNPTINYERSLNIKGDIDLDGFTFTRTGNLDDQGLVHNGYNVAIGSNFKTATTNTKGNMQVYAVDYSNATFTKTPTIDIAGGTITTIFTAGTTYGGKTVTGDTNLIIRGGTIGTIFGGSHGGQNTDSITNGDISIKILGGKVGSIYTGVNNKTGINGNVVVTVEDGNLAGSQLVNGNRTANGLNYFNGSSFYVIKGGNLANTKLGNSSDNNVSKPAGFIVAKSVTGYSKLNAANEAFIVYDDADGTVEPAFDEAGTFLGYKIVSTDTTKDIIVDGVKQTKTADNIYAISSGEHTVEFSKQYDIIFVASGADEGEAPAKIVAYDGTVIDLPGAGTMKKRNSSFVGWNTIEGMNEGFTTYIVPESDTTLYAIWNEIKPSGTESSNVENSEAERIEVTSIPEAQYDTNASISAAKAFMATDPIVISDASVVYAYSLVGYDELDNEVTEYPHGLNLRIPKSVLPTLSAGQSFRLYRTDSATSVVEPILFSSEDESFFYYTAFEGGDYTIALLEACPATYVYDGKLNADSKYVIDLYFKDVKASFGTFGLKYDRTKLTLDSFTYDETAVHSYGKVAESAGGFGSYYCANGIYQDTWRATSLTCINAETEPVKLGTFTFTVAEGVTEAEIKACLSFPGFAETGLTVSDDTLETVYTAGTYLYAPFVPSVEVICQPVASTFANILGGEYLVTASYKLARKTTDTFYNDAATGYNNEAVVKIMKGTELVKQIKEADMTVTGDADGKAILTSEVYLINGDYTIVFEKNGYVSYTESITVADAEQTLAPVTLICGDIKSSYEDTHGDDIVDIDDFIRLIRAFSSESTKILRQAVDLDEDRENTLEDLAIIKSSFGLTYND